LQTVSGEFVALYDAEDRPHAHQLIEAWQRFSTADARLACLQAPLVVSNGKAGLLPRLFSFEYAGLFRGLLPWLARRGLMMPLGGTSNHFRRAALQEAAAWDPYNVTEDADLGLRLCRFGYRTETISRPTYEDAPESLPVWLKQRTRWFKGWIQTWLVHMRHPVRLARELGLGSFIVAQVLFAGMVASALVHPLMIFVIGGALLQATLSSLGPFGGFLLGIDVVNLASAYFAFILLGMATLTPSERSGIWKALLCVPVYWLMMSIAAWRALWQLHWDPYLWEKTPHQRHRRQLPRNASDVSPAPPHPKRENPVLLR
jgi:cellulose synthase/poly-beta-1,6-N-acetylglucosamine synthase-like glycosyltransferase